MRRFVGRQLIISDLQFKSLFFHTTEFSEQMPEGITTNCVFTKGTQYVYKYPIFRDGTN